MKSNKGVTFTSLIIYILGLITIVGIIGSFSGYFFNNVNTMILKNTTEEQYSKILSYLTKDINDKHITEVKANANEIDCLIIKFEDGMEHQYINKEGCIYYINVDENNKVKIVLCNNVTNQTDNVFQYSDGKITINIEINKKMFSSFFNVNV